MKVLWRHPQLPYGVDRPREWGWIVWTLILSVAINIFWVVKGIVHRPFLTPLDSYTQLHHFPLINEAALKDPHPAQGPGNVIATSFFTDEFATAIAALGHSLVRVNTTATRVALYIPEQVSARGLCIASATGFTPRPVARIAPPNDGRGIYHHFVDQYTKLRIWELESMGARGVVYLDADTLALRNFDELFTLPFQLAAVSDVYEGRKGFTLGFNAGVLFLRPSVAVFREMLARIGGGGFGLHEAEQSFLNTFFGAEVARLPYAYNANLAIKMRAPKLWAGMRNEMRVVHFTMVKPFTRDNKAYTLVPMEDLEANARARSVEEGRDFTDEMELWAENWHETYAIYGDKLRACMKLSNTPGTH
ncbi:nucleotide-diphospho-sugar transferase [Lenzites betulinus]|nr:nucleotide-diphospho-sugar transferase [Lenzites betulinus]